MLAAGRGGVRSKVRLTLSCGDYDTTRFLLSGDVKPSGIELTPVALPSRERHQRFTEALEFDVCELQLGVYLGWKARGAPFTAIPVFPYRKFFHGCVLVAERSGIHEPAGIAGRVVGLQAYCNPVAVWTLGWLAEACGVPLQGLRFKTNAPEQVPGWAPARPVDIECVGPARRVVDLLVEGGVDVCMLPSVAPDLALGTPGVRRLWPDYRQVETTFYRDTGILPPRHTVVIKNEVLERWPWVASELTAAFAEARDRGLRYVRDARRSFLAWYGHEMEMEQPLLGRDPFPYGLAENRVALERLARYAQRTGVTDGVLPVSDLFLDCA